MRLMGIVAAVAWIAGLLAFTGLARAEGIVMSLPDGFVIGSSDKRDSCSPTPSYIGAGCYNTLKPSSDVGYSISVSSDNHVSRSLDEAIEAYHAAAIEEFRASLESNFDPDLKPWGYGIVTGTSNPIITSIRDKLRSVAFFFVTLIFVLGGLEKTLNHMDLSIVHVIARIYNTISANNRQATHDAEIDAILAEPPPTSARARKRASKASAKRRAAVAAIQQAAAAAAVVAAANPTAPAEEIPKALECAICMERKVCVTYRGCGHTFCAVCAWAAPNNQCATCRKPFEANDVMQIYIG